MATTSYNLFCEMPCADHYQTVEHMIIPWDKSLIHKSRRFNTIQVQVIAPQGPSPGRDRLRGDNPFDLNGALTTIITGTRRRRAIRTPHALVFTLSETCMFTWRACGGLAPPGRPNPSSLTRRLGHCHCASMLRLPVV